MLPKERLATLRKLPFIQGNFHVGGAIQDLLEAYDDLVGCRDEQAWQAAAEKAWADYSAAANTPWRKGPVSKIAFIDGFMMALEYSPASAVEDK